jgi:hypothetical protein
MTIQEAVDKIKNGKYSLHMDCNKVDLLNKILITAFPNKPTYNEYSIDRWFYGNQVQGRWLGKPFNNYDAPFINLSDIKEPHIITIYHDSEVMDVISNISNVLKKEFDISIEIINPSDRYDYLEYEIKKIEN